MEGPLLRGMNPHQMHPVAEVTASSKEEGLCASGQEVKLGGLQGQFQLQNWLEDDFTISEGCWNAADTSLSIIAISHNLLEQCWGPGQANPKCASKTH